MSEVPELLPGAREGHAAAGHINQMDGGVFEMLVSERHCASQKPNPDGQRKGRGRARQNLAEIQALVSAWQSGAISCDTLLHILRTGEVLPSVRTNLQEVDMLAAEPAPNISPLQGTLAPTG